jgi:hypothetical protein
MKLKPFIAITLLAALVATSCSTKSSDTDKAADGSKDGKAYPLTTCIVSGDKLGSMGKPYVYVYKDPNVKDDPGRELHFCCDGCLPDFQKEPAKYLKKYDEAVAAAKAKPQ